jgi:nitrogenase molybdenum-iron protein alpha/beta subunit
MSAVPVIPRSTCRLFGAIKALGTMKNTVILVHGPKGCVYHIVYILGMRGDRPPRIYSTCLDEQDVIFGAERKLIAAIEELDRTLSPELIAVLSCCASGIIGEDVASAVRSASVSARALAIDSGGFEGDHSGGYSDTLATIAATFAGTSGTVDPCLVNLLGVLRSGPDLTEMKRLISSVGVTTGTVLTAGAGLQDLARAGDAALNLVLCETSGLGAAEVLEARFGTPYRIIDLPVGRRATDRFLSAMLQELGREYNQPQPVPEPPCILMDVRIALFSGPARAIAFSAFLSWLNCPPRLIILDVMPPSPERIYQAAGPDSEVLIMPDGQEIEDHLDRAGINLILGGLLERPFASARNIPSIDVMHGSQATFGYSGEENLIQRIRAAVTRSAQD